MRKRPLAHLEFNTENLIESFMSQAKLQGVSGKVRVLSMEKLKENENTVTYLLKTTLGPYHVKIPNPRNFANRIYPEIALHGLLVAERMSEREGHEHSPFCSFVVSNGQSWGIPKLPEESVVCQIARYAPGKSFFEVVHGKAGKRTKITQDGEAHLRQVIRHVKRIHAARYYPEAYNHFERPHGYIAAYWEDLATAAYSEQRRKSIAGEVDLVSSMYNMYLRTLVQKRSNQLCYDTAHPMLPVEIETEFYGNLLRLIPKWANRFDRLRRTHGDFWWMNAQKTKKGWVLIDNSKFPWGDPALDVAWWTEEYRWKYYQEKDTNWRDWYELFISIYQEGDHDPELLEAMCPGISLKSLVKLNPRYSENSDIEAAVKYRDNIAHILREGKACWLD